MYNTYKLVTLILNMSDGASETIESLTKEVDGSVVPCTKEEAELKFHSKLSSVGGNPATQRVKCILLDTNGGLVKVDEIVKPKVTK